MFSKGGSRRAARADPAAPGNPGSRFAMPSLALNPPQTKTPSEWSLVAQDTHDPLPVRTFPCQIGRHPTAPIRIVHPTVSTIHAELRRHGDTLELADLGSRNGTFINGRRLSD